MYAAPAIQEAADNLSDNAAGKSPGWRGGRVPLAAKQTATPAEDQGGGADLKRLEGQAGQVKRMRTTAARSPSRAH